MLSSHCLHLPLTEGHHVCEMFVSLNSAVTLQFLFSQLGGTRLGAQQCKVSCAHMSEIGKDTKKTSRAFSDHPVIQCKTHTGNNSTLPELGTETSQAPILNKQVLAQAQVSSGEIG